MTLTRPLIAAALGSVLSSVPDAEFRLVGTSSCLLRGIDLPVGDIDILFRHRSDVDDWFACLQVGRAVELRLISEVVRGRPDRVGPIVEYLRARGCDVELVRRGLLSRGVEGDTVGRMIDQLSTDSRRVVERSTSAGSTTATGEPS